MIKIQDSVPSVYYNNSRDFQLIGHLFDLVLNAIKTDADLLFNLPLSINSDDQLLELMAYTFGLRLDGAKYSSKQLRAVCSVAPQMMKAKGSKKAVQLLCTALMHADGLEDHFTLSVEHDTELVVSLPPTASCREIILEILPYILPAGMVFTVVSAGVDTIKSSSIIGLKDIVTLDTVETKRPVQFSKPDKNLARSSIFKDSDGQLSLKQNIASNALLVKPTTSNTATVNEE